MAADPKPTKPTPKPKPAPKPVKPESDRRFERDDDPTTGDRRAR